MISYQAFTNEIDELDVAVEELVSQLNGKKLLKNTVAIVFADYDADCDELSRRLDERLEFPFIGSTVIGTLNTEGFKETGITVLVLTADDCDFSVEFTEKLTHIGDNKLIESYNRASSRLPEKEKVIITYLPWNPDIIFDEVVDLFDIESGGVPIFGGICADGWDFAKTKTFSGGKAGRNNGVILLISGNINPVILRNHSASPLMDYEAVVTAADGNLLKEVAERRVEDYLSELGFLQNEENTIGSFLATPFIVSRRAKNGDRIELLRSIASYSASEHGLHLVGGVKRGDIISASFISKNMILASLTEEFDKLIDNINTQGGFSTILCSSCGGRYSLIVGDKGVEARSYINKLPENVNMMGGYLFGEFCPARGDRTGKLLNAFNNETFAIMAF